MLVFLTPASALFYYIWLKIIRWVLWLVPRGIRIAAELILLTLWVLGMIVVAVGRLGVATYHFARSRMNPFYKTLRSIRGLPETRSWFRRTT